MFLVYIVYNVVKRKYFIIKLKKKNSHKLNYIFNCLNKVQCLF